ncbi:MAG: Mth938-like domain-containing protein [Alphaproteobacteria bacterium]
MDVTPLVKEGAQIIQSYSGGGFRVSGQVYDAAVIVDPARTDEWEYVRERGMSAARDLDEAAFAGIIARAGEVDVVLLGTGARLEFPEAALRMALKQRGLNVEVMDTGAACRTYNVLMAEGRRVVVALLPA